MFKKYVMLSKDEKAALKDIRNWDKNVVRVQDKGSRFVVLDNDDYIKKVEHQINRSSFQRLEYDPTKNTTLLRIRPY